LGTQQRFIGGQARAQQWCGVSGIELGGDPHHATLARVRVFGVPAVHVGAGGRLVGAGGEPAAAALLAYSAVPAQVADADPVPLLPQRDTRSDCVDHTDQFVAWHHGFGGIGPLPLDGERIGVAHPAAQHSDPDLSRRRLAQLALDGLELPGAGDLKQLCRWSWTWHAFRCG
jgi:hypothetical protein